MAETLIAVFLWVSTFIVGGALGKADRMYYEECKTPEQVECWRPSRFAEPVEVERPAGNVARAH
jgi:hypothetical protein